MNDMSDMKDMNDMNDDDKHKYIMSQKCWKVIL